MKKWDDVYQDWNNINYLVGDWAYPSEKYEFVSWDDYSQYMENKTCSKPPTSDYVCNCLHLEMRINDEILEKSVHESIYEKLVCSGVI
jgi:hypothetical protein